MLKRNLFFLFSVTVFALASVVLDAFNYNPYHANFGVFVNFFVSLFLSLAGIFAFILYYFKIRLSRDKIHASFWPSVRQGLFISLAISAILVLKILGLLDWWVGSSLVTVIVLLELFFQTKKPVMVVKTADNKG